MAEFNVRDVVGDRLLCGRFGQDLVGWHIEELRLGADKTADQPGAGNTIDFGPFTRNPFHRRLLLSLRLPASGAPEAAVATGTLAFVGVCRQPSRHSPIGHVIDSTLMYHTIRRNRHYHHVARIAIWSVQKMWCCASKPGNIDLTST